MGILYGDTAGHEIRKGKGYCRGGGSVGHSVL